MIKLLRIDDRLIHGQVAVSWTSHLGADTLVVASDAALSDALMRTAFKMAKPPQVTLSIKSLEGAALVLNNPKHERRIILAVCASPADALILAKRCAGIGEICLGGVRQAPGRRRISGSVFLDEQDVAALRQIHELGKRVFLQSVPTERPMGFEAIVCAYEQG
ncbi:PTS system sorbose subfamily IIB component [Coriobacterium glomerans PW2]|uniref:PTS system sorbose subfamily IIB component n=1 Tax=Coriobacterium glomerans (strain ATCC 49209 / DSM 20642 / JCM 10262 / PW2) TaxID=700015 RepID=F2N8K2_CORGP|nr:PTS sugar transporter subunit IIB [Coriobacterium glomerans]AEB07385.1 PTS system sorbose subfamily IIB component [Coriobacterium glomerans PW2]